MCGIDRQNEFSAFGNGTQGFILPQDLPQRHAVLQLGHLHSKSIEGRQRDKSKERQAVACVAEGYRDVQKIDMYIMLQYLGNSWELEMIRAQQEQNSNKFQEYRIFGDTHAPGQLETKPPTGVPRHNVGPVVPLWICCAPWLQGLQ